MPDTDEVRETTKPRTRRAIWIGAALVMSIVGYLFADYWIGIPASMQATYVGRGSCVDCHQQEAHKFAGSFHDRAMDMATEETVLGDFNDAQLEHHGITSRMFRRDGKFFIHTEGPDGKLAEFEIKYVFGVDPLQQYMVEFDRPSDADARTNLGRLQVLRVSWDTQRKRWFHLDPPDVSERLAPGDDAALDRHRPALEHHVRRLPQHQSATNFDPDNRRPTTPPSAKSM